MKAESHGTGSFAEVSDFFQLNIIQSEFNIFFPGTYFINITTA